VVSPFHEKMTAPRQGALALGIESQIHIADDSRLLHALEGIEQWSHLWVLFWFDRDPHFSPKVQPPRSALRRGVLATRSPHRPNPIGLTAARLLSRSSRVLCFEGLDLLDGTPILDLKPYVPYADCIDGASNGWLESEQSSKRCELEYSTLCLSQIEFLEARQIHVKAALERIFEAGAHAHPSRRIRREGARGVLAIKDFRVTFVVDGNRVRLLRLHSGYRTGDLALALTSASAQHLAFVCAFGHQDPNEFLLGAPSE
jgi:tRNA-Thr(GGU) m(6)t(6)A37 methyltransferase TsaA